MSIKDQLGTTPERGKITGNDIMDLARFDENTRHLIEFDILTWDCPAWSKGGRVRAYLSDEGNRQALESEGRGEIKIVRRTRVRKGHLYYDAPERDHEEY